MHENNYIVAGYKSWNRRVFEEVVSHYAGNWFYVETREDLLEKIDECAPRYVFFLHWSWMVPEEIVENTECVCFHMTDVPYGRGGSPLQNLIVRGHRETKLTALRMVKELDAGPVYLKENLSLFGNSAEEIYIRASHLAAKMIEKIVTEKITPEPQTGEITLFQRRSPQESEIPELSSSEKLFDFIRMLDAEGYPRSFLTYKGFKFEFSGASFEDGKLLAEVRITRAEGKE